MVFHKELDSEAIEKIGPVEYYYPFEYVFEKITDGYEDVFLRWTQKNNHLICLLGLAYFIAIFAIRRFMAQRKRFELRVPLIMWSGFLACFSIIGAARTIPELVYMLTKYSFHHSVCHPSYYYGIAGFWSIAFVLSKPVELGDTAFIVLRKQPLIFLHWYHHISVMIYVFIGYSEHFAPGRWFFVMNYTVHAFMYTYYTMRALQVKTPRCLAMAITTLQIVQMIIGTSIQIYAFATRFFEGSYCQASDFLLSYGVIMYISYFILFGHFFFNTYIKARPIRPTIIQVEMEESVKKSVSPIFNFKINDMLKSLSDIERVGYLKKDS